MQIEILKETDIYSKACGCFRPAANWNKREQEECKERKGYKVVAILFTAALFAVSGCTATNTLAKGVAEKSISGSGSFIYNRVGLDKTTQTPELKSIFVWGDYTSVNGDEILRYEKSEDSSIFNSQAKTYKTKLFFASPDKERVDEMLEVIKSDLQKEK